MIYLKDLLFILNINMTQYEENYKSELMMKKCKIKLASVMSVIIALSACANSLDKNAQNQTITVSAVNPPLISDVINVDEQQLYPQHWTSKLSDPSKPLMTTAQVTEFNEKLYNDNPHIIDPLSLPENYTQKALLAQLESISTLPSSDRFYFDGSKVSEQDYKKYIVLLNKKAITKSNLVQFALVTKRSNLRTFPTFDAIYKKGKDRDLDRFQESGVFPGEVLAILHHSADGKWALVRAYNYLAWMPSKDFAIGSKTEISNYRSSANFIVITGAKAFTNHVPGYPEISKIQLDMGTKLPLVKRDLYGNKLYGQNPYANYIVKLPIKNTEGELDFVFAPVPRGQDISVGYMAYTEQNLIKQSFKFLGERYGWGHSYNGRDCTGFVGEIYKSFGLLMPRNSGQQGKGEYGLNTRFANNTKDSAKTNHIDNLLVGDLIYISGHVMMFLGNENGQPYVIHDVKGLGYLKENGQLYRGTLNGVSVTPLLPLHLSAEKSYVDDIYNIKTIRAVNN